MKTLLIAAVIITTALTACSKSQNRKDVEAYFSSVCAKDGYVKGTDENHGCVLAKIQQVTPARSGGGKYTSTCRTANGITQCF